MASVPSLEICVWFAYSNIIEVYIDNIQVVYDREERRQEVELATTTSTGLASMEISQNSSSVV